MSKTILSFIIYSGSNGLTSNNKGFYITNCISLMLDNSCILKGEYSVILFSCSGTLPVLKLRAFTKNFPTIKMTGHIKNFLSFINQNMRNGYWSPLTNILPLVVQKCMEL